MKRKKILIAVIIAATAFALIFASFVALSHSGIRFSRGIYLESRHGDALVIIENSPIRMFDGDRDIFDGLCTGDEILAVHGLIAESYPGQTRVYSVFKLGEGALDDIPREVIESLIRLGWLDEDILD